MMFDMKKIWILSLGVNRFVHNQKLTSWRSFLQTCPFELCGKIKSSEHFMSINGALAPTVAHFPWCPKRFRLIFSNDTSLYLEYLISKAEA